jgi:hypothetical protein
MRALKTESGRSGQCGTRAILRLENLRLEKCIPFTPFARPPSPGKAATAGPRIAASFMQFSQQRPYF